MRKIISDLRENLELFSKKGKWQRHLTNLLCSDLFLVLFLSGIVRLFFYSTMLASKDFTDSPSYINYTGEIFKGIIDPYRTPIYPYFIKLIRIISPDNWVEDLVLLQSLISFFSIIFFYKIANLIFKNRIIVITASLFLGFSPGIFSWDKCILPESISVSFMLVFVYSTFAYINKASVFKAINISILALILVMLKPAFVYLVILLIIFWIIEIFKKNIDKQIYISGLISTLICVAIIFGYSNLNFKKNGINSISTVSSINMVYTVIKFNIYQNNPDIQIKKEIDTKLNTTQNDAETLIGSYGGNNKSQILENLKFSIIDHKTWELAGTELPSRIEFSRLNDFIKKCIYLNYKLFIKEKVKELLFLSEYNATAVISKTKLSIRSTLFKILVKIFDISFVFVYILLFIHFLFFVKQFFSRTDYLFYDIIIWVFITSHLALEIIGAPNCYDRLFLPVLPLVILLIFSFANKLYFVIQKNTN